MSSIVFTAPRHLEPDVVKSFAPGVLFVQGRPKFLEIGDYVSVCHRHSVLLRALWKETVWWDDKVTAEGESRGSGWVLGA